MVQDRLDFPFSGGFWGRNLLTSVGEGLGVGLVFSESLNVLDVRDVSRGSTQNICGPADLLLDWVRT